MNPNPQPVATYRLQLTPSFGFVAAAGVVDHVRRLGASHLYLSPIFEARTGSTHGYDQTDPTRLRGEFGGEEGFLELVHAVRAAGMGMVVDIVPNHMAADHANPWWWAMLRDGPQSAAARFFDVDRTRAGGKVVLPVLGGPLNDAIEAGEVTIERADAHQPEPGREDRIRYFDKLFPLRPGTATPSRELLDVLKDQHYVLVHWRDAPTMLNYRRFFDVTDLAGVRIEDPDVFEAMHAKLFELVRRGMIDGVRVDHIDGLADPGAYLRVLRRRLDQEAPGRRVFVLVEKILARDERLRDSWEADGTTGYEFTGAAVALGVAWEGFAELHAGAVRTGAGVAAFHEEVVRAKTTVASDLLAPELDRVSRLALAAIHAGGAAPDASAVRHALLALSVELDVYRTYLGDAAPAPEDVARIRAAGVRAAQRHSAASGIIELLVAALCRAAPFDSPAPRDAVRRFAVSWQQFTGPLAAKGVEDTALYRDASLPALNEVGCEPVPWDAAAAMRSILQDRAASHHDSLNTTATHDTKRGEDTRARLAAMSHAAPSVLSLLEAARTALACDLSPADLRLLVLTMAALLPPGAEADDSLLDRLKEYMRKATREAKARTSWIDPDDSYHLACDECIRRLGRDPAAGPVRDLMRALADQTRPRASVESLGAVLLKCLAPGVPDFYQGCEFIDVSLVDPDNRRPVDWTPRRDECRRLTEAWALDPAAAAAEWLGDITHDRAKLFVTWRALAIRRWLLDAGNPLTLESFESGASHREWTTACGDRRCTVQVWNPTSAPGVDQLLARAGPPPEHWAIRVTVEQSGSPDTTGLVGYHPGDRQGGNAGDRNRTCTGV